MDAPWTEVHNTPNKSIRSNVNRLGVVLHHAVMRDLDELIRLEMGAKQVSSTATCKDGRLPLMMPLDTFRAWSLSDSYWDSALRSVETCNETMAPAYLVSDQSHWSLAMAVAYWAVIDGFWPHRDGDPRTWTVLGHREVYSIHGGSYATACPGGMDLALVTYRAQQIITGSIPEEEEMPQLIAADSDGPGVSANQWAFINGSGFSRISPGAAGEQELVALAAGLGLGVKEFKDMKVNVTGLAFVVQENVYARMRPSVDSAGITKTIKEALQSIKIEATLPTNLNIPTAAENGKAARDAIVKP